MNRFAELLDRLAFEPSRNNKLKLLAAYFRAAGDPDRGFALAAMIATGPARAEFCDWYNNSGAARQVPCWVPGDWAGGRSTTAEDCEAARKEVKYQRCRNSDTPAPRSESCSGSDCFSHASRLDSQGAEQLQSFSSDMRTETKRLHEVQGKWLGSASSGLDLWSKNLGSEKSLRQGDAAGFSHDRSLISSAYASYRGKGEFNVKDALTAKDPAIRRDLLLFADAKAGEKAANLDFQSAQHALGSLRTAQSKADLRRKGMSNVADGSGRLQFIVRRMPTGQGSGLLVDGLAVGQSIIIDGPYGHA